MDDYSFWQMVFWNSPAGKKYSALMQEQFKQCFDSLQEQYNKFFTIMQKQCEEMVKQEYDAFNQKVAMMKELNDGIMAKLGFK
jgi:ClpP class serine protease